MGFFDIFGKEKKGKKTAQKNAKKRPKPAKAVKKKEPAPSKKHVDEEIDREVWPVRSVAIVEILGAPKEYVIETMNSYVAKIKKEKDINVLSATISAPDQKDKMFAIFAEIEMLTKTPSRIVDFCFDYMPSSIELLEPEDIKFNSHQFSNFFNDLQARLHSLDMLVKNLRAENKVLNDNAHFLLRNNILLSLKEKEKDFGCNLKKHRDSRGKDKGIPGSYDTPGRNIIK